MKRLKKVLKWTAIVIGGIVAILLIVNAIWLSSASSRLEKQIAAIREAGDPVCLADLARDPIPPDQNAAVFLSRAKEGIETINRELADVYQSEGYDEGLLKEEEFRTIQAVLEAHADVVPLLQQAVACPDYNPNIDYTVDPDQFLSDALPRIQDSRAVFRILWARARLLVWQGKREDALQTCFTMFRLVRHIERQPTTVGYLVSLACHGMALNCTNQVLQSGPLSREDRDALEAELALQDFVEPYRWALKTERAYGLSSFRRLPVRNMWLLRAFWNRDESFYLHEFKVHLSLVSRPYSEFQTAHSKLEAQSGPILASLVLPAMQALREAVERTRAKVRCLRVLNAVGRLGEQDDTAELKLSDLGLPAEVTTDPYTGKPLTMKKLPEGWLIYSVGKNLKDDGGKLDGINDVGFGPLEPAEPDEE